MAQCVRSIWQNRRAALGEAKHGSRGPVRLLVDKGPTLVAPNPHQGGDHLLRSHLGCGPSWGPGVGSIQNGWEPGALEDTHDRY